MYVNVNARMHAKASSDHIKSYHYHHHHDMNFYLPQPKASQALQPKKAEAVDLKSTTKPNHQRVSHSNT